MTYQNALLIQKVAYIKGAVRITMCALDQQTMNALWIAQKGTSSYFIVLLKRVFRSAMRTSDQILRDRRTILVWPEKNEFLNDLS